MDIKIFDDRILAPAKCGSRYLSKVYSLEKLDDIFSKIFPTLGEDIFIKKMVIDLANKTEYIIIRNPFEHFKSAIHTEHYNNPDTPLSILLNKSIIDNGIGHWSAYTYRFLYHLFEFNPKIKIIELKNLSSFLRSQNYNIEYIPSEYDWSDKPNWIDKNAFYEFISKEYPKEIEELMIKINKELFYYNKLIDKKLVKTLI